MFGNKKAQGLSITAIILIILGIVVLVVVILGFTIGFGNFKEWFGSSDNIEQIVTQCSVACASGQKYSYCYDKRILKEKDEDDKEDVTCYTLAKMAPEYGVETCHSISCGILDDQTSAVQSCKGKPRGTKFYFIRELKLTMQHLERERVRMINGLKAVIIGIRKAGVVGLRRRFLINEIIFFNWNSYKT